MGQKTRIMYIEYKGDDGIIGDAKIGRVTIFNKGKSLCYQDQRFSIPYKVIGLVFEKV